MKKTLIICYILFLYYQAHSQYKLTYSDTLMYFGTVLYKSNDLIAAKAKLDSCIMLNPQNDECRFYRAKIAYDMKDFELSKRIFKSVLALAERDAVSWNMLGLSFQELKQYDSAEFCFRNAVNINSKESRFFSNWGRNEYLRGDYLHAEQLYNTAILIDDKLSSHYENRAEVLKKLGKMDSAVADLKQAASINPENTTLQKKISELERVDHKLYTLFGIIFVLILGSLFWWRNKTK